MLANDIRRALTPTAVLTDAKIVPDAWQASVLESESDKQLLLCSRQSGKSTVAAALALHKAIYSAGALVICISPSQRQSAELFRKCVDLYRQLSDVVSGDFTVMRAEFANGSRIVSLPGSEQTIRGYSGPSLIIADEAARIPDSLYHAVRPMLATTRGTFLGLTTPYGCRGWFYEAWESGEGWKRTRITANDCPRIDPTWLEEERRLIGDWSFRQEYLCEFVDTQDQFFASEIIDACFNADIAPLWGDAA